MENDGNVTLHLYVIKLNYYYYHGLFEYIAMFSIEISVINEITEMNVTNRQIFT